VFFSTFIFYLNGDELQMSLYIADDAVFFESVETHYTTEFTGETPNTIRALSKDEIVELKQSGVRHIVIGRKNEATAFRREITNIKVADMYKLDDGRIPVVISWKHPDSSEKILSKAIAHYGEPAQVLKCIEELAELAEALVFTLNGDNRENIQYENIAFDMAVTKTACKTATIKNTDVVYDGELIDNIVSELADVFITATQALKIFSTPEEFQKVKDIKLNRLKECDFIPSMLKITDNDETLQKAIAHYGEPAQFLKCCEECMELALELVDSVTAKDNRAVNSLQYIGGALANSIDEIKAIELSEGLRWKSTVRDVKAITSELADVDITTKQVRKILTTEKEFKKAKDFKLNRLEEYMKSDELKTWLADKDDSAISEDLSEHNLRTITITPPERITCPKCDIGMLFVESDFKEATEFDVRCSNGHLFRVVKGDSERMDGEQ
jgi:hypothetical protein